MIGDLIGILCNLLIHLVSVSPFNDSAYFSNDFTISLSSVLFKSTDRGNTFTLVDTGGSNWDFDFYYDFDGKHIYREYTTDYPNRSIRVICRSRQSIYVADHLYN